MGKKIRGPYADIMALHPEVTGSCHFVNAKYPNGENTKFIVDFGMFQEKKYTVDKEGINYNESMPFNPEELKFCVITHNHVDHTGRLPFLVKNGFNGKIFLTTGTRTLLPLALYDSYKVVKDLAKRRHVPELYSEADVSEVMKHLQPCEFEETYQIDDNIKITFFMNGHLVGAALVLIQISYPGYDDINLLFTGDYNNKNMFFDVKGLPDWVYKLPIQVIQESTYGTMHSSERIECFVENVSKCVNNAGTAVCMAFSLGRFQEILYTIKSMQDRNIISDDIKVYGDGKLAFRYTDLYQKADLGIKKEMLNFLPDNFEWVTKETRRNLLESKEAKIIVTTAGMGTYGPAQVYIPAYLPRKNALIQFPGYTAEGTLGERLKSVPKDEDILVNGIVLTKRAEVAYTTEFSAHAKADEMIAFLKKFENLKLVLVNHGEETVKEQFAKAIAKEVEPKNVVILGREYFYRVNSYGLVKSLTTKFE